ncbi:hypothetical protein Leryth_018058 [Lithospermum erythrorhizon]|nr:hypothetical protein Leryth_018058 [Lithospermum erythrorhizon]
MIRLLGVFLIFILNNVKGFSPSLNDDVLGLIVFKADLKDPEGKLVSWNEDDDSPCNWFGVKCNPRSNRASDLVLDGLNLSGKLGRGLLQLHFLEKLSLAKNNISGNLTLRLDQLSNLRTLDLSENSLVGEIPYEFFQQCGSLRSISLAKNKFSGEIPQSIGSCSSLVSLNFTYNQFSGMLPSGIWHFSGLRLLDLSNNLLEGEIPEEMEELHNLRWINLGKNRFTGEIPDGIGSCVLLRSIDLSSNSFSGSLPSTMQTLSLCNNLILSRNAFAFEVADWIGELSSLENLDISGNNISGALPASIGNLRSLKVLNISKNALGGSLPDSMRDCINLMSIDISQNSLTGILPAWLFRLSLQKVVFSENKFSGGLDSAILSATENSRQKCLVLDISQNSLTGGIPSALVYFTSLHVMNLSKNSLVGNIPYSVGELKSLNVLDLGENQLNGSIPTEIGGAVSLQELRLDNNLLSGSIPTSIGNCSLLTSLYLSHNNLSGSIPVAVAKLTNLQHVDLSFNKLMGSLPKQLGNLGHLISFNISHNLLQGELPGSNFFNTISTSSVSGNPSLCGALVNRDCHTVLPKPIVLNPESTEAKPGTMPQSSGHERKIFSISAIIAIGAAAMIFVGVIAVTVLNLSVRSSMSPSAAGVTFSGGEYYSRSPSSDANSGKLVMFSGDPDFSTGAHALLNKDCELGRGGFGAVYHTVLKDGHAVAIKKLTVSSLIKSQDEFERELKNLGKVRHPNLVALEGYYWTPSLQLLIFEFVSGGNLYTHLHEGSGESYISWNERFNTILGTARGLTHLHQMNIIHYNIKSSNILIDSSGSPKISDYGLARLLPTLDRYVLSSKIQSALGYMAPEFTCKTVKITEKCDVYGFGVLVLETVTGKKPVEYMEDDVVVLCDIVRGALEEGRVEECVDVRMQGKFPLEELTPMMKLGLICTSQVPSNRPDMAEVVKILELIRSPEGGQDDLVLV